MSIKTTDKSFIDITNQRLSTSSRLNTYNIFRITETNQYFLNIFRNFEIVDDVKNDNKYFTIYVALEDEWWDNVSFTHYGTSYYWYLLCELNDIVNPYEQLAEGQQIKVLKQTYLYELFKNMTTISKL
ncbi:MAG: hypothetical protein KAS32_02355 [Candidatus Peribacteraceae bacterium]|nr:hypothetical protein [Candidatus Peribacteraceae bacterium]